MVGLRIGQGENFTAEASSSYVSDLVKGHTSHLFLSLNRILESQNIDRCKSMLSNLISDKNWVLDLSRPWRVPEGTRLLDFQITTRTLPEKFYYSLE